MPDWAAPSHAVLLAGPNGIGKGSLAGQMAAGLLGLEPGALASTIFDPKFSFVTPWPATGWLILLALVSLVFGWLLIARALPRLPLRAA